jgi:hypothetical protein
MVRRPPVFRAGRHRPTAWWSAPCLMYQTWRWYAHTRQAPRRCICPRGAATAACAHRRCGTGLTRWAVQNAVADMHDALQRLWQEAGVRAHPHLHVTSYLTERNVGQLVETLRSHLLDSSRTTTTRMVTNIFTDAIAPAAVADQFARAQEIGEHRLARHVLQLGHGVVPPPLTPDEQVSLGMLPEHSGRR